MAVTIKKTVSSVQTDISNLIDWKSVNLTLVLTKEVNKLQFTIKDKPGITIPDVNTQIDVYEDQGATLNVHIFGGTITERQAVIIGGILIGYQFTVIDWTYIADSKVVAKRYSQMDPQDIVADLVTNYAPAGFTTTNAQRGNFLVPTINFNYQSLSKCFQKLASLIGWEWYWDESKDLHFFESAGMTAPFQINDTDGNLEWPTLDIDVNLQNMKNSVYVIGGNYAKAFTATTTPDVYLGDGTKTVFSLAYPYTKSAMTVTLNGVSKTIGVENTDTSGFDVYYNDASRYIRFGTAPASSDVVKVYGDAEVPILAHASDAAAIATYGEYQDSIVDKQIKSVAEAQARAQAEILQYGHAVYTIKFKTLKTGLKLGQTITVNSAIFGVNTDVVIKRITGNGYSPGDSSKPGFEYQVECYGSDGVTFVDIMSVLLQQELNQNGVDASTILEVLQTLAESITITDTLITTSASLPYHWG